MNEKQEIVSEVCADLQQGLRGCELQIQLGVLWMDEMEVFSDNSGQKLFVSQLLFVEVINEQQYLDDVLLDDFGFEGGYLSPHLGLEQLHQNGQQILVLLVVSREFGHDLPSQNHSALAQPILYVGIYPELLRPVLRI